MAAVIIESKTCKVSQRLSLAGAFVWGDAIGNNGGNGRKNGLLLVISPRKICFIATAEGFFIGEKPLLKTMFSVFRAFRAGQAVPLSIVIVMGALSLIPA